MVVELDTAVGGSVRCLPDGHWTVADEAGHQLVLDPQLRRIAGFPIPDWRDTYRVHISPDHSFAAFSSPTATAVIDRAGETVWHSEHSAFRNCDGDTVGSCAVFTPDDKAVWVFTPGPEEDTGQRLVLDRATWQVTGTEPSRYRGTSDITVHPDGRHIAYSDFDGHEYAGIWVDWESGNESVALHGDWRAPVLSADAARWVSGTFFSLSTGDFDTVNTFYVDDEEWWLAWIPSYLDESRVVVAADHEEEGKHHLVFNGDTLEPEGYLKYPESFGDEPVEEVSLAGNGTGVWSTVDTESGHGRLRLWTVA